MYQTIGLCCTLLFVLLADSAYGWGGSIFAVSPTGNSPLARGSRSLFPTFFPEPSPTFSSDFSSTSSSSNNNADYSDTTTQRQSITPYSRPDSWRSRTYWWQNNVPAVTNAVHSSSLDSSSSTSSFPSSAPTTSYTSQPSSATGFTTSAAFAEQLPTQQPITTSTFSAPYSTTLETATQQQDSPRNPFSSVSTSSSFAPLFDSPSSNAVTSAPSTRQQRQEEQQQWPSRSEVHSSSPYRTKLNRKLSRVLQGRPYGGGGEYNSLFSQFTSVGTFTNTPWSPAGSVLTSTEASTSSSSTYRATNSVLPVPAPTSPTGQRTTAGAINPTQTSFKQGGHLVTYTTVKKKFLKTTIGKRTPAKDFADIFSSIGDPSLAPGEYLDGPFKRREGDANPAVSMTQQETLNSPALQQALVDKHNVLRASVQPPAANMMKMFWSDAAAKKAAEWTKQCQFDHDPHENRRSEHFKCGQNLARGVPDRVSWDTVIQLWFEEKDYFNFGQEPSGVVGHYTQLVWAQSFELGCAYANCGSWHYYVCNYCPVGNIKKRKYEPYVIGDKCSKCPGACDENGLCSNYCMQANDYGNCDQLEQTNGICRKPELAGKCAATCTCKNAGKLY